MPTNEIARSTVLYVLVADANQGGFEYRALLPAGNVQWGFAQKADIFEAALRLQPWDVIIIDDSMLGAVPSDLLAAADFAEEGHELLVLVEAEALPRLGEQGMLELCGYLVKGVHLAVALARQLRRSLYHQAMKQERSHLELEISRILSSWEQSIRDRTKKLERRNAELKAIDELKNQFLENVSHDFRTPMTLVRSYVELLLEHPPEDEGERAEFLRIIDHETGRLSRMIDDLLDLARLNSGSMVWKKDEVSLTGMIERVVGQLAPLMRRSAVTCLTDLQHDLPPVYGDGDRLVQVMTNLLENAIKYTPKGTVTVSAEMVSEQSGDDVRDLVQVCVEDTGPGIPKEKLESIFERFAQGSDGDRERGAGLGLSICREILAHHGGRIWAEESSTGARFVFNLPLAGHLDVISGSYAAPDDEPDNRI